MKKEYIMEILKTMAYREMRGEKTEMCAFIEKHKISESELLAAYTNVRQLSFVS